MLGSGSATELCLQPRQINFRSFSFEAPVVLAEHVDEAGDVSLMPSPWSTLLLTSCGCVSGRRPLFRDP